MFHLATDHGWIIFFSVNAGLGFLVDAVAGPVSEDRDVGIL
jgi:hypothetical protein